MSLKSVPLPERLCFSDKVQRLGSRLRDPEWRRFGLTLVAGKALGVTLLCALIFFGPHIPDMVLGGSSAMAQTAAPADPYASIKTVDHVNALNTVWTLLGAFLVFGMQA